ncbi:piezo-type mechanosensitive ion channel component-like isoform X2 [Ornithodoros turicata]|uniref:piezo-type mechanosensitive ion channel component-like isoform X2 n=1 Tax=Ornithodoros turicata TaxID=34597 RepID=UPI003138DE4B
MSRTTSPLVAWILFRVVLPIMLALAALFRYNVFSTAYLALLFFNPVLFGPSASKKRLRGPVFYLSVVILVSGAACLQHSVYQIVLASKKDTGKGELCSDTEQSLSLWGLRRAAGLSVLQGIYVYGLDAAVLLVAVLVLWFRKESGTQQAVVPHENVAAKVVRRRYHPMILLLAKALVMCTMATVGILHASLASSVYFFSFLWVATRVAWKCDRQRVFRFGRLLLMSYTFVHALCLYAYQFDRSQRLIPPEALAARLLGLTAFRKALCTSANMARRLDTSHYKLEFVDQHWTVYAQPVAMFVFFYGAAVLTRLQIVRPDRRGSDASIRAATVERYRASPELSGTPKGQSSPRRGASAVSFGSSKNATPNTASPAKEDKASVHPSAAREDVTRKQSPQAMTEERVGTDRRGSASSISLTSHRRRNSIFMHQALDVIVQACSMLSTVTHVPTLVTMMAWSITYHSWLTFVLLLWSCLLWMLPRTKAACLKSSPALVLYAEMLLILHFIYNLNLTDDEMPLKVKSIDLQQIGLVKYRGLSYQQLALKILFTVVFWLTLRRYMDERETEAQLQQEASERGQHAAVRYEPSVPGRVPSRESMKRKIAQERVLFFVDPVRRFLTRYSVWLVELLLLVFALHGDRVVLYRIVYLVLFLWFIFVYQISYKFWVKTMHAFWLLVVMYSMVLLILIYTYQFDNFPTLWEEYLHVPLETQKDFGLESYGRDAWPLFLGLLVPTFLLVASIWQLKYFHQGFLELNEGSLRDGANSRRSSPASIDEADAAQNHATQAGSNITRQQDPGRMSEERLKRREIVWRLMEVHFIKATLFAVFLVSVQDVCFLHATLILLGTAAVRFRSLQSFLLHCCSFWASVLFLTKMIYQLDLIKDGWFTTCRVPYDVINITVIPPPFNSTYNNFKWIGIEKDPDGIMFQNVKPYAYLVGVFTLQAFVKYRQKFHRLRNGIPTPTTDVIFPSANRANADDGLPECAMFLVNYFFYKFGVEVCYAGMVACIALRVDFYALLTAIWLSLMFLLRRRHLSHMWHLYVGYLSISLPLQYFMAVGLPPGICIEYPWWSSKYKIFREMALWLYLPDHENPPSASRILVDFFQLLFACCQLRVFAIEDNMNDLESGGSNKEIYDRHGNFVGRSPNPVPDFVSYARSSLSIIQVGVIFSSYWASLAVLFLAGTSHVSLFALGYVLQCFYYLWSGNDFYLKPMRDIVRQWNTLLAYNVLVIFIKCALQFGGCVFVGFVSERFCWLVQLFGVTCFQDYRGHMDLAQTGSDQCAVPSVAEAGLFWDGICLTFLLLQKRLFMSYYFHHVVIETLVQQSISSRGAQMIHVMQLHIVREQEAVERDVMAKIKRKTDQLRDNQQRVREFEDLEPETHFQALRSGDYYLFDDDFECPIDADVKDPGDPRRESDALKTDAGKSAEPDSGPNVTPAVETVQRRPVPEGTTTPQPLNIPEDPTSSTAISDAASAPSAVPPPVSVEPQERSLGDRLKELLSNVVAYFDMFLMAATRKLNAGSSRYRYVADCLAEEMRRAKARYQDGLAHVRVHEDMASEPLMRSSEVSSPPSTSAPQREKKHVLSHLETTYKRVRSRIRRFKAQNIDALLPGRHSTIFLFLTACYYTVVSNSDIVCYLAIVLNQIMSASLLSLPLPLMAFLWGTLSVPRPTKTFWITIVTYTEAVVVAKYFFQFDFFDWSDSSAMTRPFDAPKTIGIEKRKGYSDYALYDLMLLLVVFFHRFTLKRMGIWKDTELPERDDLHYEKIAPAIIVDDRPDAPEPSHLWNGVDQQRQRYSAQDNIMTLRLERIGRYLSPFKMFFHDVLHPVYRVKTDMYVYMFLCDFVNYFIIVFGYWAFGTGTPGANVISYISMNKLPRAFVIMLLAQFGLIFIDRALYLRKHILGKLVFQIILVIVIHIWMFFVLPAMTERRFVDTDNFPPKLWYFIKCVYLILSAYQIRSGYPNRTLGNCFCKRYSYINYILFKGYMLVPFLYEVRAVMDWIWTNTTLSVFHWLKIEDIFCNVFFLKCLRTNEEANPVPRGQQQGSLVKYGVGGLILFFLIATIWFPLLFFSFGRAVGVALLPSHSSLEFDIAGYQPLFKSDIEKNSIRPVTTGSWVRLQAEHRGKSPAQYFLSNFHAEDVAVVTIAKNSTTTWSISPPSRSALTSLLNESDSRIPFSVKFSITRDIQSLRKSDRIFSSEQMVFLEDVQLKHNMSLVLSGQAENVTIPGIFPKYFRASVRGNLEIVRVLNPYDEALRNLTLRLHSGQGHEEWWEVQERCPGQFPYAFMLDEFVSCSHFHIIVFCEKVIPEALSVLWTSGIIGLYTTFVLVLARLMRSMWAESAHEIMFREMPNVDHILQLCLDIYLVRECGEFALEEDLFAKLMFLYRSPETIIRWTRLRHPQSQREVLSH